MHHHHQTEESIYFPFFEQKMGAGAMSDNVDGHASFNMPLTAFLDHITALKQEKAQFDVEHFRSLVYAFMTPLYEHLHDEIETMRPEVLRKHFTVEELEGLEKRLEEKVLKEANLTSEPQLTYVLGDGVNATWYVQYFQYTAVIPGADFLPQVPGDSDNDLLLDEVHPVVHSF